MAYFNGRQILLAGLKGKDGITPHIGENGNWFIGDKDTGVSASGGTFGGTANIPEYDLTSLGTIEIDGDPIIVEMDTTQIITDLSNGHVKVKMNVSMANGEAAPFTNITKAMVVTEGEQTIAVVTDIVSFMGDAFIIDVMIMPGSVAIMAYSLSKAVNFLINEYMESALGGEY